MNDRSNDWAYRNSDFRSAIDRRDEDGADGNEARTIEEFPMQKNIVSQVESRRRLKLGDLNYDHRPHIDTVEPPQHKLLHFVARYCSILHRQDAQKR